MSLYSLKELLYQIFICKYFFFPCLCLDCYLNDIFWWICCWITQSCLTLCNPMDCSMPGFPVLQHLPELAQTHVHWVDDAIQPSHPLLSHPLFLLTSIFPHTRVFSNELAHQIRWPKYWSLSISPSNEYSGLISFRIDWFDLLTVEESLKSLLQHHSSKALILQHPLSLWHSFNIHTWRLVKP